MYKFKYCKKSDFSRKLYANCSSLVLVLLNFSNFSNAEGEVGIRLAPVLVDKKPTKVALNYEVMADLMAQLFK